MNNKEKKDDVIDLGVLICDMWKGFLKYWWLLPVLCCLVAGGALGYKISRYYPMYQAEASFTVSTNGAYQESNTSYSFYYNASTAEQMTKLFPYILNSDALQELMKEDLGVEALPGSLSASGVTNSNLITLKAVSSDPDMARQLVESAMKFFPEVSRYVIGETKFNVIQPAVTPEEPMYKPNYRQIVMKGILFGAAVFCALMLLYALLRSTIRKEGDIREKLNLSCVGVIPRIKFKAHSMKSYNVVDIHNPRVGEMFCQAIERLAFKVEKQMKANDWKTLVVTSTLPGEGKSSVSWNLAEMLAGSGKKILLIDADLRNPTLWNLAGQNPGWAGLDSIVKGEKKPEECVWKHPSGVWLVGGSRGSDDPHGLLSSRGFQTFLEQQKAYFDYILLDTPPCVVLSDAGTAAQCSDAVLYVVRQDTAKTGQILDGIQNIAGNGAPILGSVLNVADVSFTGYGYRYSGYNKYGKYGKYGRYGKYGESAEK